MAWHGHVGIRSAQDSEVTSRSEAKTETQVTTTFENSGSTVSVAQPVNTPSPIQSIIRETTTNFTQDLKAYLGKWVQLSTGTIDGSSTGQLGTWDFPEVMMAAPIYANKLEGFQGIRGTILVKVLINGTPYQQGRLILSFIPQGQVNGVQSAIRLAHFTTLTQLPHAEIDIACDSECVFEIPYISPSLFYNMLTGEGPWGRLYLHVYAPLATGSGSLNCSYAVWASFDPSTVELYNPTKASFASLSVPSKSLRLHGQMKTRSRRQRRGHENAPMVEEAEALTHGTISSALMATSRVASAASLIPSLKLVAGPVSWATALAGKLASSFGFSKPIDQTPVAKHEKSYLYGASLCDSPDRSQSLGTITGSAVELMPDLGPTNDDEMSYDFLVTRKAYWTRFDWTDANATGHLLKSITLNPRNFENTTGAGASMVTFRTPLAHLGHNHLMWRGNIVLTLKVVKTDSHSGRLQIVFFPGLTSAPVDFSDVEFCHRTILDLATGNEFTYVIPYSDESPYLYTSGGYGCVCIYVQNALRFPDLVASSITFLVEVSGAPGFEFAYPAMSSWMPAYHTSASPLTRPLPKGKAPMMGQSRPKQEYADPLEIISLSIEDEEIQADIAAYEVERMEGQMLTSSKVPTSTDRNACAGHVVVLGGAQSGPTGLDSARLCIGERLTSIRQLVLRFTGCTLPGTAPYKVRPYTISLVEWSSGTSSVVAPALCGDWWGYWAACYAYNRGTVRFKYLPTAGIVRCRQYVDATQTAAVSAGVAIVWSKIGTTWTYDHFTNGSGSLQVQTSPASAYFCRLTRQITPTTTEPIDAYTRPHPTVDFDVPTSLYPESILRAGGEDTQFAYFLGIPPLLSLPRS